MTSFINKCYRLMTESFTSLFCEFQKGCVSHLKTLLFKSYQKYYFYIKYKTVIYRVYKKYRDGEYLEN